MRFRKDAEFKREVAAKLTEAISRQGLSKTEAARVLGVTRQALYKYLAAKDAPKVRVLERACREWGVAFNYRSLLLTQSSFRLPKTRKLDSEVQLTLFDALASLGSQNVEVKVIRRAAQALELKVTIKFAS